MTYAHHWLVGLGGAEARDSRLGRAKQRRVTTDKVGWSGGARPSSSSV